jgi:DNA (cytosine-5)-methyltransferase 1
MSEFIPIVDLFAGPGGLGEGFSALADYEGNRLFKILVSVECDESAHRTLSLRAFFRQFQKDRIPDAYWNYIEQPTEGRLKKLIATYPEQWRSAQNEALLHKLTENDETAIDYARKRLKEYQGKPWVLIGGPPCQAYSLVGRSRRTKDKASLQADEKQTLYKCYLDFITKLKPTVFVMENVKGILSAKLDDQHVFNLIKSDMETAGYRLFSLVVPCSDDAPIPASEFTVEAERYGIPQARHRVILLGVSKSITARPSILTPRGSVNVSDVIDDLPRLRSGFSKRQRVDEDSWAGYVKRCARRLANLDECAEMREALTSVANAYSPRTQTHHTHDDSRSLEYKDWYRGTHGLNRLIVNHVSRDHMPSDLDRYLFCSVYASVHDESPSLEDFPDSLLPKHKNVVEREKNSEIIFADRFRVQMKDRPSTTITSHISKDGHYYIHYDPTQCRSLTVREAARLQTFPDDYFFEGNRTSQYQQIGNAVPPLLAYQIAEVVAKLLGKTPLNFLDPQPVNVEILQPEH